MADTPWTEGPWTLWDGDIVAQSDACNPIVTLYDDTSDADARLIAAAPDMAEALQGAADSLKFAAAEMEARGLIPEEDVCLLNERYFACDAALAKARGDQ